MNVNARIKKLEEITGLPVRQDTYSGDAQSYIVFAYNDERPALYGDDVPLYDNAVIQVNLYTPPNLDYMEYKHLIRDYLETIGEVDSIGTWIDTYVSNKNLEEMKRHTTFTVNITESRR